MRIWVKTKGFGEEHSHALRSSRNPKVLAHSRPPLRVGERRAATLSDGLPDVPASRRAVFRVICRAESPTELILYCQKPLYRDEELLWPPFATMVRALKARPARSAPVMRLAAYRGGGTRKTKPLKGFGLHCI